VAPFLLCTAKLPAAQLADMVQVRLAAGGCLFPSQDPVYGCQRWNDGHASETETEAHLVLKAMLPRVVTPAVRLVLLQLPADPES